MNISDADIKRLNEWGNFFTFKTSAITTAFMNCSAKIRALFTGNQFGKTGHGAYSYARRVMSLHPVPEFNPNYYVCEDGHKTAIIHVMTSGSKACKECGKEVTMYFNPIRVFRFASETLPSMSGTMGVGGASEEVRNTQYPEFKKWLPMDLIIKDITSRNPAIVLKDIHGGPNIIVEFVSYTMSVQATAGTQRLSIWCDEEPPPMFLEEQFPRLIAADGDILFTMTPANRLTYMYDDYYEKARAYHRTPCIAEKYGLPIYEEADTGMDIVCFQAATDDNPTLDVETIDRIFNHIDDPDVLAIRRFGVFKAISGRVFKLFQVVGTEGFIGHVVDHEEFFDAEGVPTDWVHGRGIDYHEHVPWHYAAAALSHTNEMWVYDELRISSEQFTTEEIALELAKKARYLDGTDYVKYKYVLDLIDPLASKKQPNTSISPIDDLNRFFHKHRKDGICNGAYWRGWDTKSTRGREDIRLRLKNSVGCQRPFNNRRIDPETGQEYFVPTIWFTNRVPGVVKYMKGWRLEEWQTRDALATRDQKESPQQKYSHFLMVLEALLKEQAFRPKPVSVDRQLTSRELDTHKYFNARR